MSEALYFVNYLHPALMWLLLGLSGYALFLGYKVTQLRSADPETHKQLTKGHFTARHFQVGRIIVALMVLGTFVGMLVTYLDNDKLLIKPHLVVGIGMSCLVIMSVALIPLIQQGKLIARRIHVSLNLLMFALFFWQAVSGMQLLNDIRENYLL